MQSPTSAAPAVPATTPVRVKRIGDAPGTIRELRDTANQSGGKLAMVEFAQPVGLRAVYLSGNAVKRLNASVGAIATFTAFKMSDESIDIVAQSLGEAAAAEVFS